MHRIEIIGRGPNDFDVMLFDERNTFLGAFSMPHMTPTQAYVFVRGLGIIFKPAIADPSSLAAWNYIVAVTNIEGSKN